MLKLFLSCWVLLAAMPSFAGYVTIDGKKIEVKDRGKQMYKLIPLQSIEFTTVQTICKPWMSENGILTHEKKRGSIIVYDYPDVIKKIQEFLQETDREMVNIRVEVQFDSNNSLNSVDWKTERSKYGTVTVPGGKYNIPGGMQVELPVRSNDLSSSSTTQMILTQSGRSASLWVGKTVVDPNWFNQLIGAKKVVDVDGQIITSYEGVDTELAFVDVGSKLMVRPRYLDNGFIDIEVYPEISYINKSGGQESREVESIKTRLTVRQGSRINIGGLINKKLDVYKQLFGKNLYRRDNGNNVLDMYLRATVVKPRR